MATKRVIRGVGPSKPDEQDEYDEGWLTWLLRTYTRYWYVLLCLFIDTMVGLQIFLSLRGTLGIALSLITIVALIAIELFIYIRLWGPDGRWASD